MTPEYEINSIGELSSDERRQLLEHDFPDYWFGGVPLEEIARGASVAPPVLAKMFHDHARGL